MAPLRPRQEGKEVAHDGARAVPFSDAMAPATADAIRAAKVPSAAGPGGQFVRGRGGVTHYMLEGTDPATDGARKLVVCSHGIGTNVGVFENIVAPLVEAGYTVLRYDFFNHGWSVADDKYLRYDDEVMMAQVEDLLDHVCLDAHDEHATEHAEAVHGFVGHSTGGIVGILAAERLRHTRPIPGLALVSPALWASKPLLARLADAVPVCCVLCAVCCVLWLADAVPVCRVLCTVCCVLCAACCVM